MPLKTNVGVSRKVADNNYGSRGASVNLEVELDSSLINDPERFQDRIRQVFRLGQQAIDDELNRQQTGGAANTSNGNTNSTSNGQHANGNRNGQGTAASEKQLNYARQLAKSIDGLGIRRLEMLAQKMYHKPLVALMTLEASGLIDTLKAIKDGRINFNTVLNEAAT